jgi:hypothetical protein
MNTTNNPGASSPEIKTMKVAFFALALGTAVEGFTQGVYLFGVSIGGIIASVVAALVFVTLFDLTATKNIFRVAMHFTGQSPAGLRVWIFVGAASVGIVGTMAFSQLSVPVITDVAAGDTDSDKVIQAEKEKAQRRYDARVSDITAEITKAEKREQKAKAFITPAGRLGWSPAKEQAVRAQGGSFASEALAGSSWVWSADATAHKGRRAAVAAAEKTALAEYEAAKSELAQLRQVRVGIISVDTLDTATALVLDTQKKRFDGWMFKKATMRAVTLVVVWGSLAVILISVFVQVAEGKVYEVRTVSDVAADALEGIHDALIEMMDAGQRTALWIRSNTFGLIPPPGGSYGSPGIVPPASVPLISVPAVPPASTACTPQGCTPAVVPRVPPASKRKSVPPLPGVQKRSKYTVEEREELKSLKSKIKGYTRRQKRGTITDVGEATLEGYKQRRDEIQRTAKNRKA